MYEVKIVTIYPDAVDNQYLFITSIHNIGILTVHRILTCEVKMATIYPDQYLYIT